MHFENSTVLFKDAKLNIKKKKKKRKKKATQVFQNFGSVGKGQTNIFFRPYAPRSVHVYVVALVQRN